MKYLFTYSCIVLSVLFFSTSSFAQGEFNHWFFGNGGGLDFNSGSPVSIPGGQTLTSEGCATVSDADGNLLFYTDGITVWDSQHDIMPNGTGLDGNFSSTQSGVIVKNPGSETIYTIFTVTNEGYANGMKYSEVDMTLNGGLGDVNENKNIAIETPVCEKIAVVGHSDGQSFWVICQSFGVAEYHAYHFTSDGLDFTPVVSTVGQLVDDTFVTIGYLKPSPDASKIIAVYWWGNYAELFDFDNSTGLLSNTRTFDDFNPSGCYACEFSPNSQVLYISDLGDGGGSVYQFDVSLETEAAITASQQTIHTYTGWPGGVQLAPDQKIYIGESGTSNISAINDPDILGAGCNFEENAVTLLSGQSCSLGFPTTAYVASFTVPSISSSNFCIGDTVQFSVSNSTFDSIVWDFGDPASGADNSSTDDSPSHYYENIGIYEVTATVTFEDQEQEIFETVEIVPLPVVDLGENIILCEGQTTVIDATTAGWSYEWQDGSSNSTFLVSEPGQYSVEVFDGSCSAEDSVQVDYIAYPIVDIGLDTTLCNGNELVVDAYLDGASYLWQDNSTFPSYGITEGGTFWVDVTIETCTSTDSIHIELIECDLIVVMPNVFTPNNDGSNDTFIPVIANSVDKYDLQIFNRWGNVVYETKNYALGWDGRLDGDDASSGVYYYIVKYTGVTGETGEQHGDFRLLR